MCFIVPFKELFFHPRAVSELFDDETLVEAPNVPRVSVTVNS